MATTTPRRRLVALLRMAHAAERAAALAYRGHARSLRSPEQRQAVGRIEREEWIHRERLGVMLEMLGHRPQVWREWLLHGIGRILGLLCHCSGWYLPMYGAGAIESRNIHEYEEAARLAALAGYAEMAAELTAMADCEREHEAFFRAQAGSHVLSRIIPLWPMPAAAAASVAVPHSPQNRDDASTLSDGVEPMA
jgi:demethoxyubiquinone hydroxylase (CLK1/Coq7/Cat5 family)